MTWTDVLGPSTSASPPPNLVTSWGSAAPAQNGARPKRRTAAQSPAQPCRYSPFMMDILSYVLSLRYKLPLTLTQTSIEFWVPPPSCFFFSPLKLLKLTSAVGQISKLLNVCKDCWKEHPSIIRPCTGAPHKSLQAEASDLNLIRHL